MWVSEGVRVREGGSEGGKEEASKRVNNSVCVCVLLDLRKPIFPAQL